MGLVGCGRTVDVRSEISFASLADVDAEQAVCVVGVDVEVSGRSPFAASICSSVISPGSGEFNKAPIRRNMPPIVMFVGMEGGRAGHSSSGS
jgi:hypothetical protein